MWDPVQDRSESPVYGVLIYTRSSAHITDSALHLVRCARLKVQIALLIVEQLKRPLYVPALPGQASRQFWPPRWWSELPITVRSPAHHPTQNEDTSLQNAKWLH